MSVLAILGLCSVLAAQEPVNVTDVAVDKLLDGVRVTVACSGTPNVSSFASADPAAVVVDLMGATAKTDRMRFESKYYPVTVVQIDPSEATGGLRITIRLRDLVEHKVTVENGFVVVDLGTRPVMTSATVDEKDPFVGKKLTLYVKDADLTDILRMIASQFNLNLMVSPDVKSTITVRLADVPLRTGLEALLKAGLTNMVEGPSGVIIVKPEKKPMYGEMETRVFDLDYVEATDVQKAVAKMLSANGTSEIGRRRIGDADGSTRSSMLVVTDLPEALDRVAQLVAEFDRRQQQIAIEAKFVETTLTGEDRYGVAWTNIGLHANLGAYDFTKDAGSMPLIFNNMVVGKVDMPKLDASLEILQTRGVSRVLASPRTVTTDNQTATMDVSTQIPLREFTSDPKTGLIVYSWKNQSIPVSLTVTPHITADGKVSMTLSPQVQAITGYVGPADDQRPIISSRSAATQAVVGDGEAVIIGGMIRDDENRTITKVPLLGDIPILGHLFRKTSITHTKTDLMIIVIPHILPMEG